MKKLYYIRWIGSPLLYSDLVIAKLEPAPKKSNDWELMRKHVVYFASENAACKIRDKFSKATGIKDHEFLIEEEKAVLIS